MSEAPAAAAQPKKSNKRVMFWIIAVLVVAAIEAAIFFVFIKFMGSGAELAYGEDGQHLLHPDEEEMEQKTAEIALLAGFRVPNDKDGKLRIFDFDITVTVPDGDAAMRERLDEALESRKHAIKDRIARIVRGASPRVLNEDDLRTLRLQIHNALTDVLGDPGAIIEVLIPRFVPLRTT